MQFKKIMMSVLSAVILCSNLNVDSFAAEVSQVEESEIISFYEYAQSVSSLLTVSHSTANCASICSGYNNVIQISVEQTLQKFWGLWVWNDVEGANWNGTSVGNEIDVSNSKSGLSNGTYRLKSVFTLTASDGRTETVTVYSVEKNI